MSYLFLGFAVKFQIRTAGFAVRTQRSIGSHRGVSNAVEVTPGADEAGTRRFEEPISLPPRFVANRYYVFDGGCVTYRFAFNVNAAPTLSFDVDEALAFRPRDELVEWVREQDGLELCGAGASPCPG